MSQIWAANLGKRRAFVPKETANSTHPISAVSEHRHCHRKKNHVAWCTQGWMDSAGFLPCPRDISRYRGIARYVERPLRVHLEHRGTKIRVFRVCFRAPFLPPFFPYSSPLFPLQALSPLLPPFSPLHLPFCDSQKTLV